MSCILWWGLLISTEKGFKGGLIEPTLIHPVAVVFIAISAQQFKHSVRMEHADGRMGDAIECVGLDRGIVYHIFKYECFADAEVVVKLP